MVYQKDYEWMLAIGIIGGLGFGYGTGANDVANAFGTSVGSGALTNRQATFIAAVFEFTGAMVLGRVSTATIAGSICDRTVFARDQPALAYGMMWTLIVGTIWLIYTTFYGLNVSSTHSIIGGIIGFSLSFRRTGVLWLVDDPLSIPPYKGIVPIVCAWFFAPLATGFCSACLFIIIRTIVLRSENSFNRAFLLLPAFVTFTCWINVYFVFTKGAKKQFVQDGDDWDDTKSGWVALVVAVGCGIISLLCLPLVRKRVEILLEREANPIKVTPVVPVDGSVSKDNLLDDTEGGMTGIEYLWAHKREIGFMNCCKMMSNANRASENNSKVFMATDLSEKVTEIHSRAEKFDPKTEAVFKVLQVFSACCVMFAHGAGEVGYMAGPLATINFFVTNGTVPKNVVAPTWILFISAASLVVGLATYGQKVTRAMGKEISTITATRGFAAELSTAVVIMVAAQYGLPTSSSQCITGGIVGVGVVEGTGGVNWWRFFQTFASWVLTLFVVGFGTAALFAQGLAAPKKIL